jgi:hypothetical protein
MERFFAPCLRYDDLFRQEHKYDIHRYDDDLEDMELIVDIEDVFAAGFTFWDWSNFVQGRRVWISERAFISGFCIDAIGFIGVVFKVSDSAAEGELLMAWALEGQELASACNLVARLLVTSKTLSNIEVESISAPDLSQLLKTLLPSLEKISLRNCTLDEDHCRVLAAASSSGLEIVLAQSIITNAGARIFAESFRLNQGPTKLIYCEMDNAVIADAMRGNTIVNTLTLDFRWKKHELDMFARALQEDRGLVTLNLYSCNMIDHETLRLFCLSIQTPYPDTPSSRVH